MFCARCRAAAIYLCSRTLRLLHFAHESSPTKFGFLACGVYLVPPEQFPVSSVTVALSEDPPWTDVFRLLFAVSCYTA